MFGGISHVLVPALAGLVLCIANICVASDSCDRLLTSPSADPQRASWERLQEPFNGERLRGIAAIRSLAKNDGLVIVFEGERPKQASHLEKLEFMFGAKLVFVKAGELTVRGPGVALHPGDAPLLANAYRGEINPHIGYERLHGTLNKLTEYEFAESVAPGSMPKTLRASDVFQLTATDRADANAMYILLQQGRYKGRDVKRWAETVSDFLERVNETFPQGAFIKHVGEFATKDKHGQILSWTANPAKLVEQGFRHLARLHEQGVLTELSLQESLNSEPGAAAARFMHAFLRAPETILVQERLDLQFTDLGFPLEFRVDFLDGEAVRAETRHSREYYPEFAKAAMRFLNGFFAKAAPQYRYLSGGADVAILKNGKKASIEFNVGAESEYIDAGAGHPVLANLYLSKILGRPTPLIKALRAVAFRSVAEQAVYLNKLDRILGRSRWGDFSNVSEEAFRYMRDLKLEAWLKSPTRAAARTVLRNLKSLESKLHRDDDVLRVYVKEAESFFKRRLK